MKKLLLLPLLFYFTAKAQNYVFKESAIKKHIAYLASDKLNGRGTGTDGEAKAAAYIEKEFKKLKLVPKGDNNTFFYSFSFMFSADPKDSTAKKEQRSGKNVVGFLDNGAPYTIVIGGHYDHLGLGHDHNSLDANPTGKVHNGADDNASGTAGVIELAKYYASNNVKEKYNFLFMCFSGEELGLYGSKKYCEKPTIDLTTVNCMINMDMIGRLNDSTKRLVIYGVGTAPDFVPIIDAIKSNLSIKKDSAGVGPSDQTSFYLKRIPVLHFFTGQHNDYHKPSDDLEKINLKGEVDVLNYIVSVISAVETRGKLSYLQTKTENSPSGKRKATFGVMPDYAFDGKGMRIDGVTDGKPAQKAGMQQGDVIIKVGDREIGSTKDYMNALSTLKPGDKVPVVVDRDGTKVNLTVQL